ncbi:MAG: cytoplasmic protein [Anaerolineae bacterium]|nr:cytoplasmic protein [Anaerolineae bacterium]
MKVAIVLFASLEPPCKVMHAFIFARDIKARGGEARIILEGAAPELLLALPNPEHKMHALYVKVKQEGLIAGACKACALQAKAVEAARAEGITLIDDAFGHVSLAPFIEQGFQIVTL